MTEGGKKKGRNAEEHSSRKKTREKARTTGLGRGWVGGAGRRWRKGRRAGDRHSDILMKAGGKNLEEDRQKR